MTNLYDDHDAFITSLERYLEAEVAPHIDGWERTENFPDDLFRQLGGQGYLGILVDEAYGGLGGDYVLAGAWCETFGKLKAVGCTVAVNMHSLIISHAVSQYGSEASKKKWLPRAVLGEAIGAYAFTEPHAGSDLARIRTTAVKRGSSWVLNGAKTFITNGARADFILVLAKTDPAAGYKGFTTFVVDTSLPGFKVAKKLDKLGWRSSDTAELVFEDLTVDEECVLGVVGQGWIQASKNLNWERQMLTLTALAGARACTADAKRYASERSAFGQEIGEFPIVESYLDEMTARMEGGRALAHVALRALNNHEECRAVVSIAKRLVCDDAVWVADRAVQILGGYGYTTEFSAERWWRDLRLMPIGGGTSEIMANIVVKDLLAGKV